MQERKLPPNRNLLWAEIVVDELARSGLKAVCIAPGSRSTPLTLAFAAHPGITVYPHLDERSAAFFALGIALKTDQPVALVCTSGSATANFFPAIIEAHESQVPLIILTGDRPPELRDSGANQTIDQVKLYGSYALWSVDMALPEADPDPMLLRYLRTTAARAYATANGIRKGVVHLNMPFRKPLEPTLVATDKTDVPEIDRDKRVPYTRLMQGNVVVDGRQMRHVAEMLKPYERGIIIYGPDNYDAYFASSVLLFSQRIGYPIFADPLSGARFQETDRKSVSAYDTFLNSVRPSDLDLDVDVVIRFGKVPTSQSLNAYLDAITPKHRLLISRNGIWSDDLHQTTYAIQSDPSAVCEGLQKHLSGRGAAFADHIHAIDDLAWETIKSNLGIGEAFDGAFIYDLIESLPADAHIFVGNSLPIRHVDQFGRPSQKDLFVFGNRGASGIDGNISTGLGIAAVSRQLPEYVGDKRMHPVVLLVGDVTFYHDMNGLFAVKNLDLSNVTIVLMNNNGGGIFNRLPISGYDPAFTDLFIMPHGLQFEHAAKLYGLDFVSTERRAEFRQLLTESIGSGRPRVIEVRTDIQHDEMRRKEVIKAVRDKLLNAKTQS